MSVEAIAEAWRVKCETCSEKCLLVALADCINKVDEWCWPSISTLAAKCDLSQRGVIDILRRLEKRGWITIDRSRKIKSSNIYRITSAVRQRLEPPISPEATSGKVLKPVQGDASEATSGVVLKPLQGGPEATSGVVLKPLHPNRNVTVTEPELEPDKNGTASRTSCQKLVASWQEAYQEAKGRLYAPKQLDFARATVLLRTHTEIPEIIEVARNAWKQTDKGKSWACVEKTDTITEFCESFEKIRAELARSAAQRKGSLVLAPKGKWTQR